MTLATLEKAQIPACIVLGLTIPGLAFLLAHIGSDIMKDFTTWKEPGFILGVVCLCLCASVLAVSLSHVAESIGVLTNSQGWRCWAFAVSLDLTLITMEVIRTLTQYRHWFVWLVMGIVIVSSAFLNVSAFLTHLLSASEAQESYEVEESEEAQESEELDFTEIGREYYAR